VPADAVYYELPEALALRPERTALPAEDRLEPSLAATPYFVEFEEAERLDPERLGLIPDDPPASRQRMRLRAPLGSLGIHLLTLAAILTATAVPPDLPRPIPIELVLEAPPPPPAPTPPKPEAPPPTPGRLASENVGDPGAPPKQPAAGTDRPVAEKTAPEPKPAPPPPPPKPAPPQQVAAISLPKPPTAPHRADLPHEGARRAAVPGPAATKDEYLAYLVTLTRQHLDLVPLSFVGNRSGETTLNVVVLDNGSIARINVLHSSGYPEIDRAIAHMVEAVHRFPPLPQWFQGPSMELVFRLKFPEGLTH
jgi:TonB family protein